MFLKAICGSIKVSVLPLIGYISFSSCRGIIRLLFINDVPPPRTRTITDKSLVIIAIFQRLNITYSGVHLLPSLYHKPTSLFKGESHYTSMLRQEVQKETQLCSSSTFLHDGSDYLGLNKTQPRLRIKVTSPRSRTHTKNANDYDFASKIAPSTFPHRFRSGITNCLFTYHLTLKHDRK